MPRRGNATCGFCAALRKFSLVVLATVDMVFVAIWCMAELRCQELSSGCNAFSMLYLVFAFVSFLCVYLELGTGIGRLYVPYYVFLCLRIVVYSIGFFVNFGAMAASNFVDDQSDNIMDSRKFACFVCQCKCAYSNSHEAINLLQRSLWIYAFLFVWANVIASLIIATHVLETPTEADNQQQEPV